MSDHDISVAEVIEHLFRTEYGRLVSFLTRLLGLQGLSSAEDITQEVLLSAYKDWSYHGVPENPTAWLFVAAKNRAMNLFRRNTKWREIQAQFPPIEIDHEDLSQEVMEDIQDSILRMMFVCASEHLPAGSGVMLMLNILCGFSRKEICRAFLMEEETVKKRLFRAKKKLRSEGLTLDLPSKDALRDRLDQVLTCLYLLYNEGYNASVGEQVIRQDVCHEAIRLLKIVLSSFTNYHPAHALLALMYFHSARFLARIDVNGAIVLFRDQSRSEWDRSLINLGFQQLELAAGGEALSTYHIEAAIASEHCLATDFADTNWHRIKSYYLTLKKMKSSSIIDLNLAIVDRFLGNVEGAIAQLEQIAKVPSLSKYHLLYATLASFYEEVAQFEKARLNYLRAFKYAATGQERDMISQRLEALHN